ncbi:MAG: alpha/beta fold hydrolase [Bacteroidetes bacterium]|nr:MAG: alpha/beta fold hydrolase [Bacteroidota bacterium]
MDLMNQTNRRKKIRSAVKWILWVLLVQFVLINISGILYGYKLTHFYEASLKSPAPSSKNIFVETWKLFRGPKFQKTVIAEFPHFPYETVHLLTERGLSIDAWYIPRDSSKGTVILFHGLGGNKSLLLGQAYEFMYAEFMYADFNVMLVDLRAHGNSEGNTTTLGVTESEEVKLAFDHIFKTGERNIVLYGLSLGAVVITKAIYDYSLSPSKVILDMPFGNLKNLLEGRARVLGFPEEPFGLLVTFWSGVERGFNGFDHNTCRYVKKIKCPVLLQYGSSDKLVTRQETNSIFKNIASREKKLVLYETAGHEPFLNKDPVKWRKEISDFLLR